MADTRKFDNYFDDDGILGTLNTDASAPFKIDTGDGAQKMGLLRFGRYAQYRKDSAQLTKEQAKFSQELDMLESKDVKGWYIRSPSVGRLWWSDRYCFSRDQQRSLVMAMGALKQTKRLYRIVLEHIKRVGWYQNYFSEDRSTTVLPSWVIKVIPSLNGFQIPDIAAPDHVAEYIRAFWMAGQYQFILLYPIVLIADLIKLVSLAFSFAQWKNPDESDDDNMIMSVLQAKFSLPTPFSYAIRKLYSWYRPTAGYTDETKTTPLEGLAGYTGPVGPASAIAWKHRAPLAPPFINIYESVIKDNF